MLIVLRRARGGAWFGGRFVVDEISSRFGPAPDYAGPGTGSVLYQVKSGATSAEIGRDLKAKGVVKSVDAFNEAARENDKSRNIQVGYYQLKKRDEGQRGARGPGQPGQPDPEPGRRARGLPASARSSRPSSTRPTSPRRQSTRRSPTRRRSGCPPRRTGNPEGYLFPATYTVPPKQTALGLIRQMVAKSVEVNESLDLDGEGGRLCNLTPEQVLTVASILEYEANNSEDYPKVARVLYNRLEQGDAAPARLDGVLRQPARGRRLHDCRRAGQPLGVQHLQAHRPASRADRLSRRGDDRGGADAGQGRLALLRARLRERHHALLEQPSRSTRSGSRSWPPTAARARSAERCTPEPERSTLRGRRARRSRTRSRRRCTGRRTPSSGSTGPTTRSRSTRPGSRSSSTDSTRPGADCR